jgi:signal transduction histidine kinase
VWLERTARVTVRGACDPVSIERVGRGLLYPSARVIALGRLLLAMLFLLAIWIDVTQPRLAPAVTYGLMIGYAMFAALMVAATWRNWWLDAKLAGPAHAIDIMLFMALVFLTEGYTSPFFIFFVFLLFGAAIRWGWRETALTAILVAVLYLLVGLVAMQGGNQIELYRFLIRTSQLVIVSLVVIWFGANQWRARFPSRSAEYSSGLSLDKSPLETGLQAAMADAGAAAGVLLWREGKTGEGRSFAIRDGEVTAIAAQPPKGLTKAPFIYDLGRRRALSRDNNRNLCALDPVEAIGAKGAAVLRSREGLAVPVMLDEGQGLILLEDVPHLSTDHVDLGEQIGLDVVAHIERRALLKAVEESAEARSRLGLARDLHDSVVQFLAGAAFRIEAMKRSAESGRPVEAELSELKELMLEEQGELRAFITALRGDSEVAFDDLVRDLKALTERLGRQWNVECTFTAEPCALHVLARVRLDAQQLVREGVANAVRHAGAKKVQVAIAAEGRNLRIDLINDGAEFPHYGEAIEPPQTLKERVDDAGGHIEIARGMDVTKVSITLPTSGGTLS